MFRLTNILTSSSLYVKWVHGMQMWFFHWTKLNPKSFAWFHLHAREHFSFRCLQEILSLPENLCNVLKCLVLREEEKIYRKFNIGLGSNMKLFLLFKYETEIEIDSPSGGHWTASREKKKTKLVLLRNKKA